MACRTLCVYCRQRPMDAAFAPFCSQRCKDIDLGRWLKSDYRVPAERDDAELPPERAPDDPD